MKKSKYGVNGVHKQLGEEIGSSEFKGYVVATLSNLKDGLNFEIESRKELQEKVHTNEKMIWIATGGIMLLFVVFQFVL